MTRRGTSLQEYYIIVQTDEVDSLFRSDLAGWLSGMPVSFLAPKKGAAYLLGNAVALAGSCHMDGCLHGCRLKVATRNC